MSNINENQITRNLLSKWFSEEKIKEVVVELQDREKWFLTKSKESLQSQVWEHWTVWFWWRRFIQWAKDFAAWPSQVAKWNILEWLKTSAKWVWKTWEWLFNMVWWTVWELFNQAMLAVWESTVKPTLKTLDADTLSKLWNLTEKPLQSVGEASEVITKELEKVPEHIRKDIESGLNLIWFKIGKGLLKSKPSNKAKDLFDTKNLKEIWQWTDRIVYDLWDWNVLKVAKNKSGLIQNEGALNIKLQESWVIPKVKQVWKDFVVMEKVPQFKNLSKVDQSKITKFTQEVNNAIKTEKNIADLQNILKKNWWDEVAKLDHKTFGWGDIQPKNLSVVNWKITLLDEWTVTLVKSLNKYFARNVVKSLWAGWVIGTIEWLRQWWMFDKNAIYEIWDYLVWWDILNSNTDKENEEIFIHNLAPKW